MFFTLRKIPLKFFVDIFIQSVSGMSGKQGCGGFLIRDMEDRVIFDVMDDVVLP